MFGFGLCFLAPATLVILGCLCHGKGHFLTEANCSHEKRAAFPPWSSPFAYVYCTFASRLFRRHVYYFCYCFNIFKAFQFIDFCLGCMCYHIFNINEILRSINLIWRSSLYLGNWAYAQRMWILGAAGWVFALDLAPFLSLFSLLLTAVWNTTATFKYDVVVWGWTLTRISHMITTTVKLEFSVWHSTYHSP